MEIFHRPPTAKSPAATFTGDVRADGIYAGPGQKQVRLSACGSRRAPAGTDADYAAPRTSTR